MGMTWIPLGVNRLAEETAELKAANLAAQRVFTDPAAKAGVAGVRRV